MDIFYTIDNNFVPQLAANISSVATNHKGSEDIVFHVFSRGISNRNQHVLKELACSLDQEVELYDITQFTDRIGFDFDTTGWNDIVLARLLMSEFLPVELHRVIYLDGDTIVLGDIVDLWERELSGKTLGMVCEPTADLGRRRDLGIDGYIYHNAGVLLVDLDRWRSLNYQSKILKYCKSNASHLLANDQDALNVVLKDDICTLSPRFNYSNVFDYYNYNYLNKLMPCFTSAGDYYESKRHPVIVHFLGEERPWREGNTHRFRDEYHHYLNMTPWRDSKDEQGWRLYFLAWRVFNCLTKLFPSLRYGIINSLIPTFMKYRARVRKSAE